MKNLVGGGGLVSIFFNVHILVCAILAMSVYVLRMYQLDVTMDKYFQGMVNH